MIECRIFVQGDRGSKPPPPFQSFSNFVYPTLPVFFSEKTVKAVGPLYLVFMPGEVKDPTQGNGKYLLWTH